MLELTRRFLETDEGATAVEYGLIVALVSVAAIVSLALLGDSLNLIFGTVSTELSQSATAAGGGS